MPVTWDTDAYAKLLQAILQQDSVKVDTVKAAAKMKDMGIECTPKAISHKISAFRSGSGFPGRVTGKRTAGNEDENNDEELPETPVKKKKSSPKKKATPKKTEDQVMENADLQLTPKEEEVQVKEVLDYEGMAAQTA